MEPQSAQRRMIKSNTKSRVLSSYSIICWCLSSPFSHQTSNIMCTYIYIHIHPCLICVPQPEKIPVFAWTTMAPLPGVVSLRLIPGHVDAGAAVAAERVDGVAALADEDAWETRGWSFLEPWWHGRLPIFFFTMAKFTMRIDAWCFLYHFPGRSLDDPDGACHNLLYIISWLKWSLLPKVQYGHGSIQIGLWED